MKKSIILSLVCTFVVLSVLDFLWHTAVFSGFYSSALQPVGNLGPNGQIAPLVPFLLLGDVIMTCLFVFFIPQMGGNNSTKTLAMRGAAIGLLAVLHFPIAGHAVVKGFPSSIILLDGLYGLFVGLVVSFIIGYFVRKAVASPSM